VDAANKEDRLSTHPGLIQGKGTNCPKWKGGRIQLQSGYFCVYAPGHHRAARNRPYVYEHVLIAERALGRNLPKKHPVHHFNEDKMDNYPSTCS
jgi:hypothetical protein